MRTENRPRKKQPMGEADSRHRENKQNKVNTKGLYQRAFKDAFVKLSPKVMLANPVMFVVWIGTIITALLTIFPNLFGTAPGDNQRLFNGLVTIILFLTIAIRNQM